jgi:beta-alanine--pyruvate transaminase
VDCRFPERNSRRISNDWWRSTSASTIAAVHRRAIAGSTGVVLPPQGYLKRLREICSKHGILLIFDEVITGFGRDRRGFAAQEFGS